MKKEFDLDAFKALAEKEVREYTDKEIIYIDEPVPKNHLYCVRGKYCDFYETSKCVYSFLTYPNREEDEETAKLDAYVLSALLAFSEEYTTLKQNSVIQFHTEWKERKLATEWWDSLYTTQQMKLAEAYTDTLGTAFPTMLDESTIIEIWRKQTK